MKMFESCIWNYTPLHPSILHESSVRRILCGSEEDMGTPLALSVNVGLAMGKSSFFMVSLVRNTLLPDLTPISLLCSLSLFSVPGPTLSVVLAGKREAWQRVLSSSTASLGLSV
jgi:hypothetical protein